MITTGVTPSTRSIALVDQLAPRATLEPTMTARVADQAPMSHDRDTLVSMMETLLKLGVDWQRVTNLVVRFGSTAENGPVGAHPRIGGGTARTLAGSVRNYVSIIQETGTPRICRGIRPAAAYN